MTNVEKLYKVYESSGSINEIETRREWVYRVNNTNDLGSYSSYAIYYSIRKEAAHLAMTYISIDGVMVPRVTKSSPHGHFDNRMYALSLDGFAFKVEELFENENISFQKFTDVKASEDIFTIDIKSVN
jgi:hypothetical protein